VHCYETKCQLLTACCSLSSFCWVTFSQNGLLKGSKETLERGLPLARAEISIKSWLIDLMCVFSLFILHRNSSYKAYFIDLNQSARTFGKLKSFNVISNPSVLTLHRPCSEFCIGQSMLFPVFLPQFIKGIINLYKSVLLLH
jgi:hypothetical protein